MYPVEVNGGLVEQAEGVRLSLPPLASGYANAQLDDYKGLRRCDFLHRPPLSLTVEARFSAEPQGTAGFGFWNAPIGDVHLKSPALPQAIWFFYASEPNWLPFLHGETGWFAATIDAKRWQALQLIPLAPAVVLGCQSQKFCQRVWPWVAHRMGIRCQRLPASIESWHRYRLEWKRDSCAFLVDEQPVLTTDYAPQGPLGFVCWIDNQFMIAPPSGRLQGGTLPTKANQTLEIRNLSIKTIAQHPE